MSTPQVEQFAEQLREKLPGHKSLERAEKEVRKYLEFILGRPIDKHLEKSLQEAVELVRASIEDVEILRPSSIIKPREEWYSGPQPGDRHWPALDRYLRNVKQWEESAVDSIDQTSSEVVSLLANPQQKNFRCRGLVVGHVQSGKTANMTAVIAKAIDAGYNMVVLLGGMTNKLRAQTQDRLESDIVGRHRELWQLYTTSEDEGDFTIPANGAFTMPRENGAQLAVLKKVSSRLEAFHRVIRRTPPTILRKLKVLLIDDECDQASVNSSNSEHDMTRINELIRTIIRSLPAVSYVGYTATPFANVFIDPYPQGREELDDLYPEDFVTALPQPSAYFGAREVFGDDSDEPESDAGHDMIRLIEDDEELDRLRPPKASETESFYPEVTTCLEEAVLWFIGSSAIRRRRGHGDKHMTMLVHTSPRVVQHERTADAIVEWRKRNASGIRAGQGMTFERLCEVIEREFERVSPWGEQHEIRPKGHDLLPEIREVLDHLEVVIENGESERRLDYKNNGPQTYIVVGGAVLARGLTLEGLSVSFFLRTSRQYDTLLQMGRWFGYRHGYEDLPRLWTTPDLADSFRQLARVEAEIRNDIALYREHDMTPMDFAVRVRAIPGMAITSASKMRHAYRTNISFEGRHVQTIRFDHQDDNIVAGNWKAGSRLIDRIGTSRFDEVPRGLLASDIDADAVRQFLVEYEISDSHMNLKNDHLLSFVDQSASTHGRWNLGVIWSAKGRPSHRPLGELGRIGTVTRSRLSPSSGHYADIKALMSKRDVLIDVEDTLFDGEGKSWTDLKEHRPSKPLLLLYPIASDSAPKPGSTTRVPLDAVDDLLGIAIVFPGSQVRGGNYFSVVLDTPSTEDVDEDEVVEDLDNDEAELIHG